MTYMAKPAASAALPTVRPLLAGRTPLIAILQVDRVEDALPLLEALEESGVPAIEVTLRTPQALAVIETMAKHARQAVIGAGTLTLPAHFAQSRDAGARFLVGPGFSPALAEAAYQTGLPFIPGAVSPSEILAAREHGFHELKFFPAELHGGPAWLKHMEPLFPDVVFCPTGGVTAANSRDFLQLPNVFAAGGVFMAPRQSVLDRDWAGIRGLATTALKLAAAA
ncbi:bifunctional 4-hydroxy-2-oxoglutarate aldolase/2-dehydro-3-deoxy-phosphogluconate aldolase [Roseococcus pinisoli]|uniref:2-dehydro-3-deoxy-phosphogluconate aldolase n=1 Tax=Roseococcus pinisoli TaxID=2835040 RepID=A0ABS5Q6T8_9PROT|nr:bifunctional 4-hydroxy-2-oxoglutarate aldolase/2-dehydro-3-deoxy-phosphogluconate aldolase [Roseococcus pinisoli]MBS7809314.1 bifunctional 4-hydroxy-2-oxoglutarate aldolase/2-dehydro-3-deoxy-phosphogluconate aldolase [Roseococcus pinisoli]